FTSLSLSQLASTVCELLDWRRANGALKTRECFSFLQELCQRGWLDHLPPLRATAPRGARSVSLEQRSEPQPQFSGPLAEVCPLLPWIQIPSLARHILSLSARQLVHDWQAHYLLRPLLLETLVDPTRFAGTCYRAANWIAVGATQGRGRMDRQAQAKHSRKLIFLYPLAPHAQRCLAQPQKGTHHESTANL